MTETKDVASAQATKKVLRRGISNETQAVSRIKFHEKDSVPANGLFVGHLENVTVDWSSSDKSADFPNMSIPRLTFHFESNHAKQAERRYYGHTLWPIGSSIETMYGGSRGFVVDYVFNTIKHFLDVFYLNGRKLTDEEIEALSLDFVDCDEDGAYVPVEAEEVIASYRKVFENAAAMFNGTFGLKEGETAKPCYKTADGKMIPIWMKLLRHVKDKNNKWRNVGTKGDLAFTSNPGAGLIEKVSGQNPPAILRINVARESITPKETEDKTPTVGVMQGTMPGTIIAGNVPAMGAAPSQAYNDAQGEMPF